MIPAKIFTNFAKFQRRVRKIGFPLGNFNPLHDHRVLVTVVRLTLFNEHCVVCNQVTKVFCAAYLGWVPERLLQGVPSNFGPACRLRNFGSLG